MISDRLEMDLLFLSDARAVVLKEPDRRVLMLGDEMPKHIDVVIDTRRNDALGWIMGAFGTLASGGDRILRVIGPSPRSPRAEIEVLIDEAPLRREMFAYSVRILTLSVVISAITASLLYFSLHRLMVRPMRRLTESIVRFRCRPEDEPGDGPASDRGDEIGVAERAFRDMRDDVRAALRQKTRLALLGGAVARINHDLRNALASATLASDQLSTIEDPEVKRLAPRLYAAIDRAAALCGRTLDFIRDDRPPLRRTVVALDDLLAEAAAEAAPSAGAESSALTVQARTGARLEADREQLYRLFSNLIRNAARAGARTLNVTALVEENTLALSIADDGGGIPPPIRERLFQPFAAARGGESFGLGLVIAREIAEAHGAALTLAGTGPDGTVFRLDWPLTAARPSVTPPPRRGAART
jgi:signal transduction histidine kinase